MLVGPFPLGIFPCSKLVLNSLSSYVKRRFIHSCGGERWLSHVLMHTVLSIRIPWKCTWLFHVPGSPNFFTLAPAPLCHKPDWEVYLKQKWSGLLLVLWLLPIRAFQRARFLYCILRYTCSFVAIENSDIRLDKASKFRHFVFPYLATILIKSHLVFLNNAAL